MFEVKRYYTPTHFAAWCLMCPVLEMSDDMWAKYMADRRPLTPGEWFELEVQEVTKWIGRRMASNIDAEMLRLFKWRLNA